MFSVILTVIILICLIVMGVTVGRKFPLLANINVGELAVEKQGEVRLALLEKRLRRKFGFMLKFFHAFSKRNFFEWFKNFYQKLAALEKKYKIERQAKKMLELEVGGKEEKIREKLNLTEELVKAENWAEAEKVYLEIITTDPLNVLAYLGLGKIYFKQKDFVHARELYQHILKINRRNDSAFSGLGDLALASGDWQTAKENYQKSIELAQKNPEHYLDLAAVEYKLDQPGRALTAIRKASELEPNNPKYLDFLIEASILNKNKIMALDVYNKLKNINPENQKLAEFRQRIQEM